tara:strand:+ start:299 stop:985 length:687 start_codon:yes stop_codon:yes gene_type:complete
MAIAVAATAANLYYNQPLLAEMARSLGVSQGMIGLIPFATQFGYAAAILLISPLGDTMDSRQLIRNLSITLALASLGISLAPSFWPLLLASFVAGLGANITQQLIPLTASLSTPEARGKNIATLMTGLNHRHTAVTHSERQHRRILGLAQRLPGRGHPRRHNRCAAASSPAQSRACRADGLPQTDPLDGHAVQGTCPAARVRTDRRTVVRGLQCHVGDAGHSRHRCAV